MKNKLLGSVLVLCLVGLFLIITETISVGETVIWYVDDDAPLGGDGRIWNTAFKYLQDALLNNPELEPGDEIRVAQGTYKPDQGTGITPGDRTATFQLINSVTIKGGYKGGDNLTGDEHDIKNYETILSGDIGIPDNETDNSYHVVTGADNAILDGFIIERGNADPPPPNDSGAGIFCFGTSPTINNCTIRNNYAVWGGGGMYNSSCSPNINNCTFYENHAQYGGGVGNFWAATNATFTNCTFRDNEVIHAGGGMVNSNCGLIVLSNCNFIDNTARHGGGIANGGQGDLTVTNCIFSANLANDSGGGAISTVSGDVIATNCVFSSNTSTGGVGADGGAIYFGIYGSMSLVNCTFANNSAEKNGNGLRNGKGNLVNITNCIFWDNGNEIYNSQLTPTVTYSDIQGGYLGEGNIDSDPLFVDAGNPAGDDGIFRTSDDGLQLSKGSPCIDVADDGITPNTDILGYERIDIPDSGLSIADMGAYEFVENRWFVNGNIGISGDGTSWTTAFKYLQDALRNINLQDDDEIWVAQGTYKPDQGNGITLGNKNATFQLIENVAVYGGFYGDEINRNQRDLVLHQTILSGDLISNDGPNFTNYSENTYNIVTGADDAILDGFTIRGANNGSGIICDGNSPTINRCTIKDNYANYNAAGMYIRSCSPTVTNCIFIGNTTYYKGGGIYNNLSSPTLTNCVFTENSAESGGGVYNISSSPTITNCIFDRNTTSSDGGGMSNSSSSPTITNCIFTKNTSYYGGSMYNTSSSPIITNCSFTLNTANYSGGIRNYSSSFPIITNSIFWDNTGGEIYNASSSPVFSSCDIEGSSGSANWNSNYGIDGGNNIDSAPYFVNAYNPAGNDTIFYTADDGLKLLIYASPCIDSANGDTAPLTDILGLERMDVDNMLNNGIGTPNYADIGAYETDRDSDEDGLPDDWEVFYGLDPNDPYDANYDTDSDNLINLEEYNKGTNPINPDTDSDGMPDGWEIDYDLNPFTNDAEQDPDSDGLTNLEEYNNSCNPTNPDTDSDNMPDGWEVQHGLNPLIDDAGSDPDSDGLPNLWEYTYGLNPNNPDDASEDPDDDGLTNLEEYSNDCDPNDFDTDSDELNDGDEVNIHSTNPTNPDTDSDLMPDGWEVQHAFNPLDPIDASQDPDSDGLTNLGEYNHNCDPANPDSDNDTLNDGDEVNVHNTDPADFDTDNDGLGDGEEINTVGTNPRKYDTDGDFLTDGWEVQYNIDPLIADDVNSDADGDGLTMAEENTFNSNPNNADTDGDGTDDKTEADQGSYPDDPSDNGEPPPADKICQLKLAVGDPSRDTYGCELWPDGAETYAITVGPITHKGTWIGGDSAYYKQFRAGNRYEVRVEHVGTDPEVWYYPEADYDCYASIQASSSLPAEVQLSIDDPDNILWKTYCEDGDPGTSDNVFYARNKTAYVSLVEVDLDISGVSDEDEEDTGKYIALNDDDDNNNGIPDKDETGTVVGENDLVEITLRKILPDSFTGPVKFSISSYGTEIKVWETPTNKGIAVTLPKVYTTPDDLPKTLWVEGVHFTYDERDVGLELTYDPSPSTSYDFCEDNVTFTVVGADLDIDTNNNQSIDDSEEQLEQNFPGKIICLTKEGVGPDLDDLAEIRLDIRPRNMNKGTLILGSSSGDTCIKVWEELSKTTEVILPKTYDVSTTTFPKTLYVDGVEKGKVILDLVYKDINNNEFHRDKVAILVTDTISFSPLQEEAAYIWSSLPSLGEADGDMFRDQIEDQGFDVVWYQDVTGMADNNFQTCTLSNYRRMKNSGAFCVISHGGAGAHYAVYAQDTSAGQSACDSWRGSESNMTTEHWDGECYTVRVSSKWLAANYASTLNSNKSMTFWDICYSATGNPTEGELPVKEAAGGRWRIGYEGPTYETECKNVNEKFLKRMNGKTDDTKKRTAGEAWDVGNGYTTNAAMDGNDWTTLCPAPMLDADYPVWPDSDPGNRKGWGCIIFDTYMSHTNADDALIKVSGGTTSNHRWAGRTEGKFILGFDYDKTDGIATTMRAVGAECRCDGPYYGDGRRMDADRIAPNDTDADPENREWSY